MALDIGSKHTGVAISDLNQTVAFARDEIRQESKGTFLQRLRKLIEKEEVVGLLVGLPLNSQGLEGMQAQYTRELIESLQKTIEIPVEWLDERLTTQLARRDLNKRRVDSECAQLLLSLYLQRRQRA